MIAQKRSKSMKPTYLYQTKQHECYSVILKLNKYILIAYISLSDKTSDYLFHAAVVRQ